jgi:DNA-binding NarL/FixJ family response regulator
MTGRQPIRVIIADDQAIVRSGLAAFLLAYDDLELVGQASDGEEAVELCELVNPDVVLMDVKMPHMDGITATRAIHKRWPDIHILVLTSFKEKQMIEGALEAGASGYLLKNIGAGELADAILKVSEGHSTVSKEATQALIQGEHLEALTEELRHANPDPTQLSQLLALHLPEIFPNCQVSVMLFPNQHLFTYPESPTPPVPEPAWAWLHRTPEAQNFSPGEEYPWGGAQPPDSGLVLMPVLSSRDNQALGGVAVVLRKNLEDLSDLLTTVETLAGHIAAVFDRSKPPAISSPAQEKVSQELATAGKIQSSILPDGAPKLRGWELAARLEPAHETSGDFYDFIPLSHGKLGIVIADVSDKGIGAALFMALTSTLIRTYAAQYPTLPAFAFSNVNRRILSDTRGSMFVTAFYGVLEPDTGRLRYVNAGHNPPYLISSSRGKPVDQLRGTGMALGVEEDATWNQKIIKFAPGDLLLMYTDGITEARNSQGRYFGEQRIFDIAQAKKGRSAREIQDALIKEVDHFTGGAPRHDDITLVVVRRKES